MPQGGGFRFRFFGRTMLLVSIGLSAVLGAGIHTGRAWDPVDEASQIGKSAVTSRQPYISGAPNQLPTNRAPAPAYVPPAVTAPPPASYYVPQSSQSPVVLNPDVANPNNFYRLQPPVDCSALWAQFYQAVGSTGYGVGPGLYETDALLRQYCGKGG